MKWKGYPSGYVPALIKYDDFLPIAVKHLILYTVIHLVPQKCTHGSRRTDLQSLSTVNQSTERQFLTSCSTYFLLLSWTGKQKWDGNVGQEQD